MYVAVKGGQKAIAAAHALLAKARRGDPALPELDPDQIASQLTLAVDRVQAEGSLWAPELAARAVKQARGDLVEAAFLLRAHRSTLRRLGWSEPVGSSSIAPARRISATFKDLPGGQILGPTFDYTHRLLDPAGAGSGAVGDDGPDDDEGTGPLGGDPEGGGPDGGHPEGGHPEGGGPDDPAPSAGPAGPAPGGDSAASPPASSPGAAFSGSAFSGSAFPGAATPPPEPDTFLAAEGLLEPDEAPEGPPGDITRRPPDFPADRRTRLQCLARADEGFLLGLAYSCQRGWGAGQHPFVTSLKTGTAEVELRAPELGFPVAVARVELSEVTTATSTTESAGAARLTKGYGLAFGRNERKALAMAIVDRAMRSLELGERIKGPAQDQEFVLGHCDNVEASGFVSHLKLPHHVDFQSDLLLLRRMRDEAAAAEAADEAGEGPGVKGTGCQGPGAEGPGAEGPDAARPGREDGK